MIRRTKAILNLPSREDKIMRIPFDDQEKEHYQRIERPTVDMLDQTEKERKSSGASWMTTIQQINKLRLVCNLGTYVPPRRPGLIQSGDHGRLAVLGVRFSIRGETCAHCLQSIELLSSEIEMSNRNSPKVYHSNCDLFFCVECSGLLEYQTPRPCRCTDQSRSCSLCPLTPLVHTPRLTPTVDSSPSTPETDGAGKISTKIRALITQIKSHTNEKQ
jgi:SWI/SNF-related matrix-associated actin-dependent regulator of chromatin subfamily A3